MPSTRGARFVVRLLLSAFLFALLGGCSGAVQPFEVLAPQVSNLRAQFNKDAGKVRILILPAPT